MNGLNLKDMNASDMIDVLHYFLEDDMNYTSAEQADAKERFRAIIYKDMYNQNYAYSNAQAGSSNSYSENAQGVDKDFNLVQEEEKINAFDPMKKPPKPFTPATQVNASSPKPFGSVLDEPLSR